MIIPLECAMEPLRLVILGSMYFAAVAWASGCTGLGFSDDDDDDDTSSEADDDASDDHTSDDDDDTSDDDTSTGDDDTSDDDTSTGDDDTADQLEGLVYFLDLADESFEFTEPAGVGALLQSQIPDDDGAVFAATSIGSGSIEMLFGAALVLNPAGAEQDWIWEQTDHPTYSATGSWSGLSFDVGPFEMTIEISGADVWFGDAQLSGTYTADGSEVHDAEAHLTVDTTDLSDVVGMDLCALLTCVSCPASCPNQGDHCVQVVAEGGTCPLLDGLYLVEWP